MYKGILDEHKNGILILDNRFEVIYVNNIIQNIFNKGTKERCGEFLECLYQMEEKKRCMETTKCSKCNMRINLKKIMDGKLKNISIEKLEYEGYLNGEKTKVEMALELKGINKDNDRFIYLEIYKMKTEREILISSRRLIDEILDTLDDYIFYKNKDYIYVYANKSYCNYVGMKKIDLIGKSDLDIFPKEFCNNWRKSDEITLENGFFIEEAEDRGRHFKVTKNKVKIEGDFLISCIIKDITFEKLEMEKAYLDNLTGLGNRRGYDKKIMDIFKKRLGDYKLILLDLDFLRELNNEWGHSVGDIALKEVAEIIKESNIDEVYRIGGDEFALIIKSQKDVIKKLEEINTKIKNKKIKTIYLSSSIGVIDLEYDKSILHNFNRVDKALYRAKKEGRGRIVEE